MPYDAILHFDGLATNDGVGAGYYIFDIASGCTICYGAVKIHVNRLAPRKFFFFFFI
jgi:hypothetical protein